MAIIQKIRRNILNNEWEHYVEPSSDNMNKGYWAPGLYQSNNRNTNTVNTINRNAAGFLLSYEEAIYPKYYMAASRTLTGYEHYLLTADTRIYELRPTLTTTEDASLEPGAVRVPFGINLEAINLPNVSPKAIILKANAIGGKPPYTYDWFQDDQPVIFEYYFMNASEPGQNQSQQHPPTFLAIAPGKYEVKVTDMNSTLLINTKILVFQEFKRLTLNNIIPDQVIFNGTPESFDGTTIIKTGDTLIGVINYDSSFTTDVITSLGIVKFTIAKESYRTIGNTTGSGNNPNTTNTNTNTNVNNPNIMGPLQ